MSRAALQASAQRIRFGDVVRLCTDRSGDPAADGIERFVGLEHIEPGDFRIRGWGLVAEGTTFTNRFHHGQVLFGKRRAYQRKVAVADFDGVCSGDIYVLEATHGALRPELLPFVCSTEAFFEHAVKTSAGSLSPRTNWKSLAEWTFALPSRERQTQLSRALGALQRVFDSLRDAERAGRVLLQSLREALFALDASHPQALSQAVGSSAYGPRFPATKYTPQGLVRTIRTTDMPENGAITYDTAPGADIPDKLTRDHRLESGDFLISRTGFTSGRAAVFRDPGDGHVYVPAAFLVRLRLVKSLLLPQYLIEYLQTSEGRRLIQSLQRGTQQLNISASALLRQAVPMPDLNRQQSVTERLQYVRQRLKLLADRANSIAEMRSMLSMELVDGKEQV